MDILTLFLLALIMLGGFVATYLFFKSDLQSLRTAVDSTRDTVSSSLAENTSAIYDRLQQATREIGELKREAGAFTEVSRGMRELHEFLRSPKLRGNIGEMILQDLISQIFPRSSYQLQYQFRSGERVDAVIKTDAGLLPIDSKFPMESYERLRSSTTSDREQAKKLFASDIRRHLSSIAKKYILPSEDTLDFALMYIPSESVYYELVGLDELMTYARRLRVYPVSPNTLYAALQTILLSFEGRKIESRAKEVFQSLRALSQDFAKTKDELATLGGHLSRAASKFAEVDSRFNTLANSVESTRSLDASIPDKQLT